MDLTLIGPLILGAVGLVMLIAAAWAWQRTSAFLKRATTTVGVVADVLAETTEERQHDSTTTVTYFYPVVHFQTAAGAQVEFRSNVGTSRPGFRKGQQVPVVYDPARPDEAKIRSFVQLWLLPLALGSIGIVLPIIAAGLLWSRLR